jgi:hypothetical protein
MKRQLFTVLALTAILFTHCKKDSSSKPVNNNDSVTCNKLNFFQFADNPNPWFFEYNSKGKLSKTRWYPNGPYRPVTKIFEYDTDTRLAKIYDSLADAGSYTSFSGYNASGAPVKALEKSMNKKIVELEFIYDSKTGNIIKKVFQFFDGNEVAIPVKDTMLIYYDLNTNNVTRETAITNFNGVRREYILLEADGYDNKPSYYKSLGNEFAYLYRWNRGGEGFLNQGFYLFSPNANNPGRVYLHNQNVTDDKDKGDYISYSYQYGANGYPVKFTHTYTNPGGTNPGGRDSISYSCK